MTDRLRTYRLPSLLAVVLLAPALLAGCSRFPWETGSPHPVVATPDSVEVKLADAADKAAAALQSLSAVEQVRTPAPIAPVTPEPTDGLENRMSVDWTGPVEPLLSRLAARAGYTFRQLGWAPAVPLVVQVDTKNRPIYETLRDVGLQIGSRGSLVVDADRQTVELNYGPVAR
jgi:defect-in-organelle-trafficking protein DotD